MISFQYALVESLSHFIPHFSPLLEYDLCLRSIFSLPYNNILIAVP